MWKIAIVDDDYNVLAGLKNAIPWAELDAEWVGEAADGEQGLQLLRACQPDIVITDIYMPVLNGLDMVERLANEEYSGKIIILSGYSEFEYARQALRLGISDYLSKPVTVHTIRSVLQRTIAELEEELMQKHRHENLLDKLRVYEPFIEREWIKSVAIGTAHTTSLLGDGMIPEACRYWHERSHVVIGIEMIRTDRIVKAPAKDVNLFRFAVANIVQELTEQLSIDCHYIDLFSNYSAVIVHLPMDAGEETDRLLYRLGEQIIRHVRNFLNISLYVGIGKRKPKIEAIADSTEEAFQAILSKHTAPVAGVLLYRYADAEESDKQARPISLRSVKFYQQLAESVKLFQESNAKAIVQDYFRQWHRREDIPARDLQGLGMELWTILTYALFESGIDLEDIYPIAQVTSELAAVTDLQRLQAWLNAGIGRICEQRGGGENIKHRQAVDFIIQYIHDHYAEPITITELADRLHISRNYLSHLFKLAAGESFNSYLTRVRMEKAKKLILEGKHLIYEVAEQVGYKNVPYFSTLFKKYNGYNPTELLKQ